MYILSPLVLECFQTNVKHFHILLDWAELWLCFHLKCISKLFKLTTVYLSEMKNCKSGSVKHGTKRKTAVKVGFCLCVFSSAMVCRGNISVSGTAVCTSERNHRQNLQAGNCAKECQLNWAKSQEVKDNSYKLSINQQ